MLWDYHAPGPEGDTVTYLETIILWDQRFDTVTSWETITLQDQRETQSHVG